MAYQVSSKTVDGHQLKLLFHAGVSWLSQHVDVVNRMNVYPVPDGDTGINMYHTLKRAYQEIEALNLESVSSIAQKFAYGALMGARGNSGTILSQLLKGFADGLGDTKILTPAQFLSACEKSIELGYQSVNKPVEGTILTVARESFASLKSTYQSTMTLEQMLDDLTSAAQKSLTNTPNLLPVLKDAGVVDSGGMGLVFFLQGMNRYKNGDQIEDLAILDAQRSDDIAWETALMPDDDEGYGYDVQFLMLGDNLDVNQIRGDLESIGWSVLVVGDSSTLKVHIHVHNPADPFNYAIRLGAELDDIVVENMHRQYQAYIEARQHTQQPSYNIPSHGIAVVSVAVGDGITAVLQDLRCTHVLVGGQTMNPSTEDFLSIINDLPTDTVILLPNNSNIILTAQQTAKLVENKVVQIVPTKSIMQGISALIAYGDELDDDVSIDGMVANMTSALDYVVSIEITRAIRSVELDGKYIAQGHYMGIVDDKIAITDVDLETTVLKLFAHIQAGKYEIATIYYGEGISQNEVNQLIQRLSNADIGLEFEAVYGGQPLYPYLISVE